jgi:hypothetical protein
MKLGKVTLQMSGVDLANLNESEIIEKIKLGCEAEGVDPDTLGEINVYVNIEGTAVTAYYVCDICKGAIRLN